MPKLVVNATSTAEWRALVSEAGKAAERRLDEELESYLVFLLMRFTSRPELVGRILALEYLRGLAAGGRARQAQLRDVGDQCLLYAGLFPEQARRRLVPVSYFVTLGRSAYDNLGTHLPQSLGALYQSLAEEFIALVDVLLGIRALGSRKSTLEPLDAFDLWSEAGSAHARAALRALTDAFAAPYPQSDDGPLH